jgi:CheY-like chemotaxis protein
MKILIVDDMKDMLAMLKERYEELGHHVFTSDHVFEVVSMFEIFGKNHPFDLIICDFEMPRLTGLEVFSILKRSGISLPHFVLFTSTIDSLKELGPTVKTKGEEFTIINKDNLESLDLCIERVSKAKFLP